MRDRVTALPKGLDCCVKYILLSTAILFVNAGKTPGQTPTDHSTGISSAAKEAFLIEKLSTVMMFENDGTSTRTTSSTVRVQSEAGVEHWGIISATYSSADEQAEFGYVRVRKADGTVIQTPAENVQDVTSEIARLAPTYTDYREKHVAVKGLGVGEVLEYEITIHQSKPLIPGQFWFAYDFEKRSVVLEEEVQVSLPKGRVIKVKSPGLIPSVSEQGNRRVYLWKTRNDAIINDQEVRREFPPPAVLLSTFQNWEEVGRWWNGLEQERLTVTPEIRAKAVELTQHAKTREEKTRALYNYVATRFRYIGISFGIGRYKPHAAEDVLNNAFGDCKDKQTLLASLLQAVGIEAYPALMNSARHIDPDVPSPGQFDHVVTAVPEAPGESKLIWLDTTAEVAPYGLLLFNLRDKQALVIPNSLPARLETTPADPPFQCYRRFEMDTKLSDAGVLEGKMLRTYRGDAEVLVRALFRQFPPSQWKDVAQGIAQGMGYGGEVSDVQVGSIEDTTEPFQFSNQYIRKDYPDWPNRRITPPLGVVGFPEIKEDEKRTQPILLGAGEEIIDIAKVELPKGYVPRLLPDLDVVRDFAEYHSTYKFRDGVFVAEVHILVKKPEIPLSALKQYQSFQRAIADNQNQYTELVTGTEALHALAPSSNKEVSDLVQQAREAAERMEWDQASDDLQRALKLDAQYRDAWLMLGGIRLAQNRTNEGLAALHKAIEVDPQDTRGYKILGMAYMRLLRQEEAIPVWRDLLKHDPKDADAHANLGAIFVSLKRYQEAVPELEAAMALNKPTSAVKISLANAYIGAGNPDKAVPLLKETAESALNPTVWNDAAYYLADNRLALPDAQRYAEKAVRSVEDDAAKVALDKLDSEDLRRMVELASFWDTLGWVYFREGDLTKAQRYLEAAWDLEQLRVNGEHLADVYKQQNKKAAADHQRALAEALPEMTGLHKGPNIPIGSTRAAEELSQMRRTKLGKLATQPGSAEFFVLMAPAGVEDVKFISGAENLRSFSKVVASIHFKTSIPDDSPVKLVRRGVLVCQGGTLGCDFTLFTVDSVHSTN